VLWDCSQHDLATTTVAVHSLRANVHAHVWSPLGWDEIGAARRGGALALGSTPDEAAVRVARYGDTLAALQP